MTENVAIRYGVSICDHRSVVTMSHQPSKERWWNPILDFFELPFWVAFIMCATVIGTIVGWYIGAMIGDWIQS